MNKFKKMIALSLCLITLFSLGACKKNDGENGTVYVYNWGDYIDESVLDLFEKETGIKVVYSTYNTNEDMYPIIKENAVKYDLVCPSDYMVQKMKENDLIQEINYDNIPNIKNMDKDVLASCAEFDPENKYCVPYNWGTVGILYNTTMVDEPVESWDILWNETYKNNILMMDSVRDLFLVGLIKAGFSPNSTSLDEINTARDLLIEQKPLVQAYYVDETKDQMIAGNAALAVVYSGDYLACIDENEDLAYAVPKEGSNVWFDGWVIPKNAENKENAEAFINFLCRADIALKNFEYIGYPTPNAEAKKLIEEDIQNDLAVFPDKSITDTCDVFIYLGEDTEKLYNNAFLEVKSK